MGSLGKKRIKEGVVISMKMAKTAVVGVDRTLSHPRYHKVVRRRKKYYAHCVDEGVEVGSRVRIRASRPLSRLKRWRVVERLS